MKPIPKSILIHSATLTKSVIENAWGNKSGGNVTQLKNVRFEPTSKLAVTKDNKQVQLSAIMFYDIKNSTPAVSFSVDDNISFDNSNYTITTIDKLYDRAKLHHLEIGLSL